MKQIIYAAILTVALLSFGRQQSVAQDADAAAEQEVRQTIEKYRTALLPLWRSQYCVSISLDQQFPKPLGIVSTPFVVISKGFVVVPKALPARWFIPAGGFVLRANR